MDSPTLMTTWPHIMEDAQYHLAKANLCMINNIWLYLCISYLWNHWHQPVDCLSYQNMWQACHTIQIHTSIAAPSTTHTRCLEAVDICHPHAMHAMTPQFLSLTATHHMYKRNHQPALVLGVAYQPTKAGTLPQTQPWLLNSPIPLHVGVH